MFYPLPSSDFWVIVIVVVLQPDKLARVESFFPDFCPSVVPLNPSYL